MKKKSRTPLLGEIFKKIAPKIGATFFSEPQWGIVSQITFKNGKKCYVRYNCLDINTLGASEVSVDKDYATFFMKRMGYPTIPGKAFYSPAWARAIGSTDSLDAAYQYAKKLGLPVIVKPNSASQGRGVTLVYTKTHFYSALRSIFKNDRVALVQTPVTGNDYRIVVLDDEVISAYQRLPLSVTGDGRSTIQKLLSIKQKYFKTIDRDIKINIADPRITRKLARVGMTLTSIPKKDEVVTLLDNANLSTGGDSVDMTQHIHPLFKKIAVSLTKDMGLRLCGVDLMVEGSIEEKPNVYWVIEINAAPGLDNYITSGIAQQKIVEDLYLKVLKSMEK